MPLAIRVENLSKRYFIGKQTQGRYVALRDVMVEKCRRMFTKPHSFMHRAQEEIWALRDVGFEVKQGERVGIIGRNGAGKTTLLKILSRITEPTKGRVCLRGTVASLLEVGTGFHPELTGRENIYLNGAILGMKKADIRKKFDEIVAFSEIEKFIDTPVKRYSSGMYVRLAFAVAAHLEPEVLLVDEVLAVGDLAFQKKCLGKMENVTKEGRTVLFVSHNMSAISQLCPRTILLNEGVILEGGPTQETLNIYISMTSDMGSVNGDLSSPRLRLPISDPESRFKWTNIDIINSQKQPTAEIRFAEPFEVIFKGYANKKCEGILVGFGISSKIMGYIFTSHQLYNGLPDTLEAGITEFHIEINPNLIAPGYYDISIAAVGAGVADYIPVAIRLHISEVGITPDRCWHYPHQGGIIDYPCKWSARNTT